MAQDDKALSKALDWVVKIDPSAIIASVKSESESSPHASNRTKVDKVFSCQEGTFVTCLWTYH